MNTGLLQAIVAYKVTDAGEPVDVDGNLTSVSGKRQAIALLQGRSNPNPALYEIEYYFSKRDFVSGQPTTTVNLAYCPVSIFTIDTSSVVLHPGNVSAVVNVFASFGWTLVAQIPQANAVPNTGLSGVNTPVTISRTSTLGQGYIYFKDNITNEIKGVYVVNTDALGWILESGTWNNLRFWEAAGIWNF